MRPCLRAWQVTLGGRGREGHTRPAALPAAPQVHRLSPLKDEGSWRLGAGQPGAAAGAAAAGPPSLGPARLPSISSQPSDSTPLLFALDDMPTPTQPRPLARAASAAAGAANVPAEAKPTIDTLQLLLGPASDAEAMVGGG